MNGIDCYQAERKLDVLFSVVCCERGRCADCPLNDEVCTKYNESFDELEQMDSDIRNYMRRKEEEVATLKKELASMRRK